MNFIRVKRQSHAVLHAHVNEKGAFDGFYMEDILGFLMDGDNECSIVGVTTTRGTFAIQGLAILGPYEEVTRDGELWATLGEFHEHVTKGMQ
jgi:hypothetical protein